MEVDIKIKKEVKKTMGKKYYYETTKKPEGHVLSIYRTKTAKNQGNASNQITFKKKKNLNAHIKKHL